MTLKNKSDKTGYYTALAIAAVSFVTFGIAATTTPVSGPYCKGECVVFPYTDIISRFPGDYIWMYPAIILILLFVVLIVCIHNYAENEKKIYSRLGLTFSVISATMLILDYYIQISVIQPSLLNGETEGIAMLSQYNPHGVFIALEEAGYWMMSLTFLSLFPVFSKTSGLERTIRWVLISCFVMMIVTFLYFSLRYGIQREYRFEVAAITINWTALIVLGILLALFFRKGKIEALNIG